MGPKQKGGGGGNKQKGNATEEVEETLQAVVFADTFETRFEPFTLEKPRVCLGQVYSGSDETDNDSVSCRWLIRP